MHIESWISATIYLAMVNGNGLNKMLPQTFKVETNTERERDRKKAARRLCHTRKITKSYIMNLRDKPKSSHQWQLHHAPPCWTPAANENAPSFLDHLCMGQWISAHLLHHPLQKSRWESSHSWLSLWKGRLCSFQIGKHWSFMNK